MPLRCKGILDRSGKSYPGLIVYCPVCSHGKVDGKPGELCNRLVYADIRTRLLAIRKRVNAMLKGLNDGEYAVLDEEIDGLKLAVDCLVPRIGHSRNEE